MSAPRLALGQTSGSAPAAAVAPRNFRRLVFIVLLKALRGMDCTYFLIFFGRHRRFFFAATAPQSLQRKSPGFAFRRGASLRHFMAVYSIAGDAYR
jgi:hypothetical protein